jgi:hypothetical protein
VPAFFLPCREGELFPKIQRKSGKQASKSDKIKERIKKSRKQKKSLA